MRRASIKQLVQTGDVEYRKREWDTHTGVRKWMRGRGIELFYAHISSFSQGLFHGGVGGRADVVRHVRLSFGLDRLHRLHQAAAGQHHVACSHVFRLQLPQALLAVPHPVAKIHKETWKTRKQKKNCKNIAKLQNCCSQTRFFFSHVNHRDWFDLHWFRLILINIQ